jgi:DNA-binding response OmpR family regulator
MRVLVAEDDPGLRSVLTRGLREYGYVVDTVADGREAVNRLMSNDYEVGVIDWRMPMLDGLAVIAKVRRGGVLTPLLMLTARDTTADRVTGLNEGADDYLVKPFQFSELLARLRALQRRPALRMGPQLSCGDVTFDPNTRTVTSHGNLINLTGTEMAIFELLVRRAPVVVTRRAIAVQAWDDEADAVGSNTIDVHIRRLRTKLAGTSARIETVRGSGYRVVSG